MLRLVKVNSNCCSSAQNNFKGSLGQFFAALFPKLARPSPRVRTATPCRGRHTRGGGATPKSFLPRLARALVTQLAPRGSNTFFSFFAASVASRRRISDTRWRTCKSRPKRTSTKSSCHLRVTRWRACSALEGGTAKSRRRSLRRWSFRRPRLSQPRTRPRWAQARMTCPAENLWTAATLARSFRRRRRTPESLNSSARPASTKRCRAKAGVTWPTPRNVSRATGRKALQRTTTFFLSTTAKQAARRLATPAVLSCHKRTMRTAPRRRRTTKTRGSSLSPEGRGPRATHLAKIVLARC